MNISCPECGYKGNIKNELIPKEGKNVTCPKCKCRFFISLPDDSYNSVNKEIRNFKNESEIERIEKKTERKNIKIEIVTPGAITDTDPGCIIFILFFIVLLITILILIRSYTILFLIFIFLTITLAKSRTRLLEKKKFKRDLELLYSSQYYQFVKNFVLKYKYIFPENEKELLLDFLNEKGFRFSKREISWLIINVREIIKYESFREKILYNRPKNPKEYILNFLEIGSDYSDADKLKYFFILLNDENIEYDRFNIEKAIKEISKEKELSHFEKRFGTNQTKSVFIEDLDSITGYEFESFLKTIFERMGYTVEHTRLTGDQGADLIISKFGEKIAVQAKRNLNKVSNRAIQEVVASVNHYGADRGMVVTNSRFTSSAIELAASNNVKLINRDELEVLINKYY